MEAVVGVQGAYHLTPVYPNPFRHQAHFHLAVAQAQPVRVEVFNVQGQRVARLYNGVLEAGGTHRLMLEGHGLPSGTYLYRIVGTRFAASGTVTLLR